jgi:hypothetical protein
VFDNPRNTRQATSTDATAMQAYLEVSTSACRSVGFLFVGIFSAPQVLIVRVGDTWGIFLSIDLTDWRDPC